MIGFYDYTVIMTYISVVSSMIGIFCAVTDHISAAVCCLAFSGLCDMFDGKIARTEEEQNGGREMLRDPDRFPCRYRLFRDPSHCAGI